MKSDRKQRLIIENQLNKAFDIVSQQKKRYESLQSEFYQYPWTCEDDGTDNEIAIGIMSAMGGIQEALENLYF